MSLEEKRERSLKYAEVVAEILNWVGGSAMVWMIFIAKPLGVAIVYSIIVFLLSLIAVIYFKGLIRVEKQDDGYLPSIWIGLGLVALGLLSKALFSSQFISYFWPVTTAVILALIFLFLVIKNDNELQYEKIKGLIISFLIMLGLAYGSIATTNCFFDRSTPSIYKARVTDKHSGKGNIFYVEFGAWKMDLLGSEVNVSKRVYNKLEVGDSVNIHVKKGLYEMPWISLVE